MTLDTFIELLLGAFSLIFGVWLFDYILKRSKREDKVNFKNGLKLYLVSITFMLIGLGLILATILSYNEV